jgi:hypothetical protein
MPLAESEAQIRKQKTPKLAEQHVRQSELLDRHPRTHAKAHARMHGRSRVRTKPGKPKSDGQEEKNEHVNSVPVKKRKKSAAKKRNEFDEQPARNVGPGKNKQPGKKQPAKNKQPGKPKPPPKPKQPNAANGDECARKKC